MLVPFSWPPLNCDSHYLWFVLFFLSLLSIGLFFFFWMSCIKMMPFIFLYLSKVDVMLYIFALLLLFMNKIYILWWYWGRNQLPVFVTVLFFFFFFLFIWCWRSNIPTWRFLFNTLSALNVVRTVIRDLSGDLSGFKLLSSVVWGISMSVADNLALCLQKQTETIIIGPQQTCSCYFTYCRVTG